MKTCTLLLSLMIVTTLQAQTKEATFAKIETLLKKSKGIPIGEYKLSDVAFSESSIKLSLAGASASTSGSIQYSKMNWDEFGYSIQKMEGNESVSSITISLSEEMQMTQVQNNKELDKSTEEEFLILVKTTDASSLRQLLDELQTFTWKSLNEIRVLSKTALISYTKEKLNEALSEDDAEVKNIYECEITITTSEGSDITLPTAGLTIHSKELVSEEYMLCYGKSKALIKISKGGSTSNKNVEHPDVYLYFENDNAMELEYAIKRLAKLCE